MLYTVSVVNIVEHFDMHYKSNKYALKSVITFKNWKKQQYIIKEEKTDKLIQELKKTRS